MIAHLLLPCQASTPIHVKKAGRPTGPMVGDHRQLVTSEPVEVQDCRKITDHSRAIYRIYPNSMKENRRLSTCNLLDLQTLASQPVMPKTLPDHWPAGSLASLSLSEGELAVT